MTTYKTYYGTHEGHFLGVAPTHRKIHFETVDVMRVQNGKITDHWGVGNLLSLWSAARPSSNWRLVKYAASLIIGMQLHL